MLNAVKSEIQSIANLFNFSGTLSEGVGLPDRGMKGLSLLGERELYKTPQKLEDILEFVEYTADTQCFQFSDKQTYGQVFEISIADIQGKTQEHAIIMRDKIANAVRFIPQHMDNPYVLQIFSQDESISYLIEDIKAYQQQYGEPGPYRDDYNAMWKAHLKNLSKEGGYFKNEKTGHRWGGINPKVRWCIYRKLAHFNADVYDSPEDEMASVCNQVRNALNEAGLTAKVYDPADVYNWLVPWLNPSPEGEENGYELVQKYPLNYTKGEDYSGLKYQLFKHYPYFDVENRCITFNNKVHCATVAVDRYTRNPHIGKWNVLAVNDSEQRGTLKERLPEGTVICITTVFMPSYETERQMDVVKGSAKGETERMLKTRQDISDSKLALDSDNALFPTSIYLYIKGRTHKELKRNRRQTLATLRAEHFDPVELTADLSPVDNYIKYLPFSYKPQYEKDLFRNRLVWDKQLVNLMPMYGANQGTGNPGFVFSTPDGSPFTVDILSKKDKTQNSFLSILAPPGSGKSALVNQLIAGAKATHNPFFIVIDVGGSFKVHAEYIKSLGYSVNYFEISKRSNVSLTLFGDAISEYLKQTEGLHDEEELDLGDDEDEDRDPMMEMILTAKLMVTKGMVEAEKDFKPNDYNMLNNAILSAAKKVHDDGGTLVRPEHVADALWHISETGEMFGHRTKYRQERMYRAADMAEAMQDYTQGIKGQFFNREGQSWPECDFLVLDLKVLTKQGYEDILYLTFVGLMNAINNMIEARRHTGRQTIVINDESHIINMVRTLALFKRKSIKMWRKLGCWLWESTQNVKDYPDEAGDILSLCEWMIVLKTTRKEIEAIKKFRDLSAEEESMIESLKTVKGKYAEFCLLGNTVSAPVRSVPPTWYFVMGQTEQNEYAQRMKLAKEHNISEMEAAKMIADQAEIERCAS